jgi:MoaA/NifB/PqqE/SkfB family radical SAM enzyme
MIVATTVAKPPTPSAADGLRTRSTPLQIVPLAEATVDPASMRVQSADLYINTLCNFTCTTCFLGDAYFQRDLAMTPSEVRAIARWLRRAGTEDIAVLGGEPTLHRSLVEIMRGLREEGIRHIRLITNGTPRGRHLLEGELDGLVDLVYVSLDGAHAGVNDAIRGKGAFRHAMATMELLRERGMPFVITSTLGRAASASEEVSALLALAEASGCKRLNVHWLSAVGRARNRQLVVSPGEWAAVASRIARYTPKRPDLEVECQVGSVIRGAAWANEISTRACAVRERSNLEFMPDGQVFSCGLLVDSPGVAAYRWDGQRLLQRGGSTELTMCNEFEGDGCPARQTLLDDFADSERLPVCIYQRIRRAQGPEGGE